MADNVTGPGPIAQLIGEAWSPGTGYADPDDPKVVGFAEFGLSRQSPLVTQEQLKALETWRDELQVAANSAFLDGTLLLTVEALLGWNGREVLTPVTLWELAAFIDAVVCFDRLYCVDNPAIDVARFNHLLGAEVLTAIPDPDHGMLRQVAEQGADQGARDMRTLRRHAGRQDAFDQEVQAVVAGWRAVLGPDFPVAAAFDTTGLEPWLVRRDGPAATPLKWAPGHHPPPVRGTGPHGGPAIRVNGATAASGPGSQERHLRVLIEATRVPVNPAASHGRPELRIRRQFAALATYRTHVDQGIANALALPYLPGTLRMPYRRLFVERAAQVQDELVSVALANRAFALLQPSAPLTLPFFTAAVLQQATTRSDIWTQLARLRDQSVAFRRARADLDRHLARSEVSDDALRFQSAVRDQALNLADVTGAAQQTASVALGVIAQTGILPLAGALQVPIDAAQGLGRSNSWSRIWRRLFHRHEYFLTHTNSQAIALTNAMPQVQELWQLPRIGGYLSRFADATREMGKVLRD